MTPMQSDWSLMGLRGIIPSLLHHTLLGYNFLIPDAVGNTTAYGSLITLLKKGVICVINNNGQVKNLILNYLDTEFQAC